MSTATTANPQLGWALYLASLGWSLFPLHPGTKQPTGHRAARCPGTGRCAEAHQTPEMRATTDLDAIRAAWEVRPWNIGVATGPSLLVVVDCDMPKDGDADPDGLTALAALAALAAERGGPLPATYTVTTPSTGRHLYYVSPPGAHLRSTQSHICPNVDTRAWGGYVVGPGSVLPNGGYELQDETNPVELPGWLVQANVDKPAATFSAPVQIRSAKPDAYGAAALRGEVERVRNAAPGSYNEVLSTAAYTIGRKVGAGLLDATSARAELIAAGETLVSTARWPRSASEVVRVVDAGLTAGSRNPVTPQQKAA
jgi:hypothetical protein